MSEEGNRHLAIFKATDQATGNVVWVTSFRWFLDRGILDMGGYDSDGRKWGLEFVWNPPPMIDFSDLQAADLERAKAAYEGNG